MRNSPKIEIKEYMQDKLVRDISVIWKILHLCGFLSSCVIGFIAFILMKKVSLIFENECILYSDLEIEFISPTNWTILIENSSWGRKFYCEIPQIVSVFSFIYGTVLLVFFSMCGSSTRGITNKLSPPKNIVVPGLIFCFVFTCLSIYCSIHVQFGYHMFCLNLKNNVLDTSNNLYVWDYFLVRCAYSENLSTGGKSLGKDLLYLDIACIFILLQCLSWAFNTFLLLLRCCCVADFKLMVVVIAKYSAAVKFDMSFVEYLTRIILPPVEDTSATYKTSKSNDFVKSVKNSIMKQMNVDNTQSGSSKSIRLPIHQESTIDIMHPDGVDKLAESYKLNQNELSGFVKKTIMTQMGFIQLGSVSSSPELEKSAFSISQTESGNTDTTSVKNNKPNENELLNFANSSTERCMIGQRGLIKSGTIESSSQEVNAVNKMQDGFSDNSFIRNIISQIELPQTDSGIFGLSRKEEKAIIITQTESRNSDTTSVNKPN